MNNSRVPSHYAGTTKIVNGKAVWTGVLRQAPDHILTEPLRRKKPTMWFVNSMSDLFHEDVPDAWIDRVFAVMALSPQHSFQVLTKRSKRMRNYVTHLYETDEGIERLSEAAVAVSGSPCAAHIEDVTPPLPNVWLGVSAEDQKRADGRIPDLLMTPAAVRFVSAEPLLGPIDFQMIDWNGSTALCSLDRPGIGWIIAGGESGPGARPMHPDWARSIRDQCTAAGVPFFFKQHGEHEVTVAAEHFQDYASHSADDSDIRDAASRGEIVWPDGRRLKPERSREWWEDQDFGDDGDPTTMTGCPVLARRVGKATAGRLLDGREWNEMPVTAQQKDAAA
jgi:protein gp37